MSSKNFSRAIVETGVLSVVCILHSSTALSDELCAALDPSPKIESGPLASGGACPSGMVEVDADFCPFLDQICIKKPVERSYRCSLYAKSGKCQTGTKHL